MTVIVRSRLMMWALTACSLACGLGADEWSSQAVPRLAAAGPTQTRPADFMVAETASAEARSPSDREWQHEASLLHLEFRGTPLADPAVERYIPLLLKTTAAEQLSELQGSTAPLFETLEEWDVSAIDFQWSSKAEIDGGGVVSLAGTSLPTGASALVSLIDGNLVARIDHAGQVFELRAVAEDASRYVLMQLDPGLLGDGLESRDDIQEDTCPARLAPDDAPTESRVEIRVLTAITPRARDRWWTSLNQLGLKPTSLAGEVDLRFLDEVNTTLKLGEIPVSLVSAKTSMVIDFREGSSSTEDLPRLAVHKELLAARERHGADLVVVVTDSKPPCGYAAAIGPCPDKAIALVSQACLKNLTMAHEIGHLLGLRHEKGADDRDDPFTFQHGYHGTFLHDGQVRGFRTIMASECAGQPVNCPRVARWSDPQQTFNGSSIGHPEFANSAEVIRRVAPVVSRFAPDPPLSPRSSSPAPGAAPGSR